MATVAPTSDDHRQHKRRQAARKKNAECDCLLELFAALPDPGGPDALARHWMQLQLPAGGGIDWGALPASVVPALGGSKKAAKAERRLVKKRVEVDSFAAVLLPLLRRLADRQRAAARRPLRVVDFACGSGALLLPLAVVCRAAAVDVDFIGVDMKPTCCRLLDDRAAAAGLAGAVRSQCCMVEQFLGVARDGAIVTATAAGCDDGSATAAPVGGVDVVLGLHACGNATDHIQELALRLGAAYLVSPCCIGKLSFSMRGGTSFSTGARPWAGGGSDAAAAADAARYVISHPRSQWLAAGVATYCGGAAPVDGGSLPDAAAVAMAAVRASPEALVRSLVRLADISTVEQAAGSDDDAQPPAGSDAVADEAHDRCYPRRLRAARLAKLHVELDRSMRARENGYATQHFKLLGHDTAQLSKSDLLLGLPAAWELATDLVSAIECDAIAVTVSDDRKRAR
jgi:hypothetical protein